MAWSKQGTSSAMLVDSQVFYTPWAGWNQAPDPVWSFDARSQPSTVSDWFLFRMAKQSARNWIWDWDLSSQGSHTAEETPSAQPMASHCTSSGMQKGLSAVPQMFCGTVWLCAGSWIHPQVSKQINLTQRNFPKYNTLICFIQIQRRLTKTDPGIFL